MVGGTNAVNIYNITGKTWRIGPTMPSEISGFGYVQAGQYLYVVGGMMGDWYDWNDNSSYTLRLNLATEEWEEGPTFTSRRAVTDLSVTQGHLYAIGGDINGGERTDPTGQVEVLDLSLWPGGSWEDLQQPTPWALEANWGGPCTEAWSGGEIWSVGGASGIWLQNGMWNWTTIDGAYYLSIGEPCVQNIVNLSDAPMYGEAESGSIVTYTVDITNTGNIVDYYNLTYSSEWPAYKVLGGPGPVGPGETIQVVIEIDVPPDAKPGDIGLTNVRVEFLRDPSVMDTIQIYTTVLTTHRVSLIPGDMEDFGIYGEVIPYTLTVTNQGNITDTYVLTFTSAAWEVVLPVGELELGAGESADIVVLVTIPLDVQLGASDVLILTATCMAKPEVTDSATLTTTAFWYRMLLPLEMKH